MLGGLITRVSEETSAGVVQSIVLSLLLLYLYFFVVFCHRSRLLVVGVVDLFLDLFLNVHYRY